jgi:DNA repair protein RadC
MNVEVCASRLGGEKPARIGSSRDLVAFLFGVFPTHEQHREHFMIVCLDAKNAPIGVALISVGGTAAAQVEMAQIFKPALLLPAVGIALAHNHPSDTSDPSHDDVVLTQRITRAADLLGIRVLDHIILTSTPSSYFSFLDAGMMSRD